MQLRLDIFLVSQDFQYLSPKCTITPIIISDHSLVQFSFKQNSIWTRGREIQCTIIERCRVCKYNQLSSI